MEHTLHNETKRTINRFALKNYDVYTKFCKGRDLVPMPFSEFLKNYV